MSLELSVIVAGRGRNLWTLEGGSRDLEIRLARPVRREPRPSRHLFLQSPNLLRTQSPAPIRLYMRPNYAPERIRDVDGNANEEHSTTYSRRLAVCHATNRRSLIRFLKLARLHDVT